MREQKWNLGRFIGRSSALLLLFALLFLPSARAEEGENLPKIIIGSDEYLLLADYRAYCDAERRMAETYENRETWNRMSLHNIARSGIFAADRAVAEYADNIWDVPHR